MDWGSPSRSFVFPRDDWGTHATTRCRDEASRTLLVLRTWKLELVVVVAVASDRWCSDHRQRAASIIAETEKAPGKRRTGHRSPLSRRHRLHSGHPHPDAVP